ncbi:hypothetical protein BSNK01_06860 [Bacillaceae bacterium]
MFTTSNLTNAESISLSKEIALVGVQDTPFTSLLLSKGLVEKANGKIHSWVERSLNETADDISVPEGSETTTFYESGRAEYSNVCQIFKKGVSVSGTVQAINVPGVGDEFAQQVNDRLIELKIAMEKAFMTGTRNDGSQSPFIRRTDGIDKFVDPSNVVQGATAGVITEDELKATVRKLWEKGIPSGEFYALVNADIKEQIDEMYKNSYRYVAQENEFGLVVDVLNTNYGRVNFILSRHVPTDKMFVFDVNYVAIGYLREPMFEALAKTGDSVKGHVLSEATLVVRSKKAVAMYDMAEQA